VLVQRLPKVFVGREAELTALRAALADASSGRPQLVLVEGPAGIGKTTLLDQFLTDELGVRVLRANGEAWEAQAAYGVVDQLARSAGLSGVRLLAGRQPLRTVEEPIAVGGRILELWGDLQDRGVVVTVIDDAQWADVDSLRALLFALRRLVADRVLVLLVVREEDGPRLPEGLRRMADGPIGVVLSVGPLDRAEVQALTLKLRQEELSQRAVQQLHSHTQGNPLYLRAVLEELPAGAWPTWKPTLPAPRAFVRQVERRLQACPGSVRRLVEAASVLGTQTTLKAVAAVAGVDDEVATLDAAVTAGLLKARSEPGRWAVAFPHPLVQAAVQEQLGPARTAELHLSAASVVEDRGAALRHRVAATAGPDPALVAELEEFAQREAARGGWASAATALVTASQLSATRAQYERLLVRATDATVAAGDLLRARPLAAEIRSFAPDALRDSVLGYLAVLSGQPMEAEKWLQSARKLSDATDDAHLKGRAAQRSAFHAIARLHAGEMVEYARRAVSLAPPGAPEGVDAAAILGIGLGWLGRTSDALGVHEAAMTKLATGDAGVTSGGLALRMANGWLRLAFDDFAGALVHLTEAAPAAVRLGSNRVAMYAYAWLARTHYYTGAWDEAIIDAERALALLLETGHEWLRPFVRWTAIAVSAARGDWAVAGEHARLASAHDGDYPLMIVSAALARAHLAAAQGEHDQVLRVLDPLLTIAPREAIDEPGFWPWQDLYGDALVSIGRLDEADAFLGPHQARATQRGRRSMIARLARVRGRLETARGRPELAEAAFKQGIELLKSLPMPFEHALLELAYGQALRRDGKRRAAATRLQEAYDRFSGLLAEPYVERCERELHACGLSPVKRREFDAQRLTPQELVVARLGARGLSNREIAAELMVSIKTVQSHLTRIYAKVGAHSRAELGARLREWGPDDDTAHESVHLSHQ
jgi:DNA-binding CsgD family transcriptional regulator/tetratricopeptide (TPR) repeat protein